MDYKRLLYGEIAFVNGHNTTNNKSAHHINGIASSTSNNNCNHHDLASPKKSSFSNNNTNDTSTHAPNGTNSTTNNGNNISSSNSNSNNLSNGYTNNEQFQAPKQQLCDPRIINLSWSQSDRIGGGLINIGNTCFLNSVLQCLTYCPPLHNYLIKHEGGHSHSCKINQFCMLCEMERHIRRIKQSNGVPIKPISIVQRLKFINKSFQYGRQEDAHEFLRYVIDHMWKACLTNLDIKSNSNKLDARIKETTAINHIFGGYHRSQVLCLSCNNRSNTYDYFMDFILDIRQSKSLEEALKKFTQPETLQDENAYKCGKCKRKVTARKRFSVYKAPNVATFQLKRFDSDRIFGGKVTKFISYPEELDLRPYMSDANQAPIKYHLSAVLVHVGHSSNSGHYFCYVKNSNNLWYRMDDSDVSTVSKNNVMQQQAYVLFYTMRSSVTKQIVTNGVDRIKQQNLASINGSNNISLSPIKNDITNQNNSNQSTNNTINHNGNDNNINTTSSILNLSNVPRMIPINGNKQPISSSLATWSGQKSKLEEDHANKKSHEALERDKFNEELDQGKRKKIKGPKIDDFFRKTNPFQTVRN